MTKRIALDGKTCAGNPHAAPSKFYGNTSRLCRIAAMCAVVVGTAAYAADYYVDANYGNDEWDGITAAIPSQEVIDQCTAQNEPIPGPRKTLHAMMSDARVDAGDTVWAAEGDYNEGGDVYDTQVTINRVQVKGGVMLRASGSRDATFISGADGDAGTYSNGATRCVFFLAPAKSADGYGIVKGFTVRNGRTCADDGTDGYGGASTGAGLMVECDFQNNGCHASSRGGTINGGYALRCKFSSAKQGYQGYSGTWVINSLILTGGFYSDCRLVNCTLLGSSYPRNSDTYNCLFIGTGAASSSQSISGSSKSSHKRTYSRSEFSLENCTTSELCRVVSAAETPYDGTTYRPLPGSVAIDAGDTSYYVTTTNKTAWKRGRWLAEAGKDYYGNDRVVNGTIDIGCGEAQADSPLTISDDSDGLVVTGAAIGTAVIPEGSSIDVTFARNFTSDRLCTGVEVNGEFHSFGGTTSDVPYDVTFPAVLGGVYNIAAVYETDQKDWYVSPTGDDTNKGYHKNCPRRTLDKAMALATANADNVVHAAAGIYDEGEVWAGNCSNRVLVAQGVGLVADEWPLRETVIKGAADTVSADADEGGNGPAAVRCVAVARGGYVRGFKLTGGRTGLGTSNGATGGGAYLGSSSADIIGAALIDCEVTGNGCAYRGRGVRAADADGALIRCYVHDQACGSYEIIGGKVIDSHVNSGSSTAYYGSGMILNSTILGGGNGVRSNMASLRVLNTYLEKVTTPGSSYTVNCTNCVFTGKSGIGSNCFYDEATCRFSVPSDDNLDENFRPKTAASPLVDFGSKELYDANFPSEWVQFKGRDFAGGQRIYNGQIDVGCGEYDFRPDFAGYLGPKAVVSEMGPNVTTNAVPNIVVPEGESITVSMAPKSSDRPTAYELVYTPDGGSPTVVSESSTEPFSRTLDGACTVQSLVGHVGLVFSIR